MPAKSIEKLQEQLDEFRNVYNTQRPHKALLMRTPQSSYEATIKATPKEAKDKEHYRIRHDTVDQFGKISLRRAGKMHHLGVGIENRFKKVYVVVDHYKVTVVEKKTGEVLSKHIIEPSLNLFAKQVMLRGPRSCWFDLNCTRGLRGS